MHGINPFQNIKDYWGSYYSSITEGAVKDALHDMGYYFTDEGEHAGKWVHEKTGKALSTNHAMEIAAERANRKKKRKNKETDAAGPNPTDKDARKQGEESTRSEEIEHDGDQLDELSDAKMRGYVLKSAYNAAVDAPTNQVKKRLKGIGTALKSMAGYRSNTNKTETIKKEKVEHLFHKDSDRLLREHIRAEYEERGIYPTSREVQETYNMVMDLIEKRKSYEQRTASLMLRRGASGKQVKDTVGQKRTPEGKSGNAILRKAREDAELQGIMQNHFTDDNDEPIVPRIQDHLARRGKKTKISPSSPARKQSEVEVDTRFLMGQGFSPSHLRRIMTDSGR